MSDIGFTNTEQMLMASLKVANAEIERLRAEVAALLSHGDRTNTTINALQTELEKYKLNSTTARVRELEGLFDYMKARAERAEAELQHARETAGQLFKELMEKLGYWVPPVEQEAFAHHGFAFMHAPGERHIDMAEIDSLLSMMPERHAPKRECGTCRFIDLPFMNDTCAECHNCNLYKPKEGA